MAIVRFLSLAALATSCFALCYEEDKCSQTWDYGRPKNPTTITYGRCESPQPTWPLAPTPDAVNPLTACVQQLPGQKSIIGPGDGVGSGTCGVVKKKELNWVRVGKPDTVFCHEDDGSVMRDAKGDIMSQPRQHWRLVIDENVIDTKEPCGGVHNGDSGCTI